MGGTWGRAAGRGECVRGKQTGRGLEGAVNRREQAGKWLIAGRTVWQQVLMGHTRGALTSCGRGQGLMPPPPQCWAGPQAVVWAVGGTVTTIPTPPTRPMSADQLFMLWCELLEYAWRGAHPHTCCGQRGGGMDAQWGALQQGLVVSLAGYTAWSVYVCCSLFPTSLLPICSMATR